MTKNIKYWIVLFFSIMAFTSSGQEEFVRSEYKNSNNLSGSLNLSNSHNLYIGETNDFIVYSPFISSRELTLIPLDSSVNETKMDWKAHVDLTGSCARLTLPSSNTIKSGAYFPNELQDSLRYVDTNSIYWEKEYTATPTEAKDYVFKVYYQDESELIFIQYFILQSKEIPTPTLDLDYQFLLTESNIKPTYDKDLRLGKDWYKIRSFIFQAKDKKGKVIFEQKCFGNIITPEMKNALVYKKTSSIVIKDAKSKRHTYKALEIERN